jgi:hypothetical protein
MLTELQGGYTKFCCRLREWDSQGRECHYRTKKWPLCSEVTPGQKNVAHPALMDNSNTYLPHHIKLGLIKISVKAMDKEIEGFAYLRQKFPKIREAKMKEGLFIGPHINKLIEDHDFSTQLNVTERRDWKAFENVHRNFLGNEKVENYGEILQDLISSYSAVGCSISLNLHFLHSWIFFSDNMGVVSNEQGKRFHQNISQMEKRYSG